MSKTAAQQRVAQDTKRVFEERCSDNKKLYDKMEAKRADYMALREMALYRVFSWNVHSISRLCPDTTEDTMFGQKVRVIKECDGYIATIAMDDPALTTSVYRVGEFNELHKVLEQSNFTSDVDARQFGITGIRFLKTDYMQAVIDVMNNPDIKTKDEYYDHLFGIKSSDTVNDLIEIGAKTVGFMLMAVGAYSIIEWLIGVGQ